MTACWHSQCGRKGTLARLWQAVCAQRCSRMIAGRRQGTNHPRSDSDPDARHAAEKHRAPVSGAALADLRARGNHPDPRSPAGRHARAHHTRRGWLAPLKEIWWCRTMFCSGGAATIQSEAELGQAAVLSAVKIAGVVIMRDHLVGLGSPRKNPGGFRHRGQSVRTCGARTGYFGSPSAS